MLLKGFLAGLCGMSLSMAMELTQKMEEPSATQSDTLSILLNTSTILPLPRNLVPYFRQLQSMIDDVGAEQPIPLKWDETVVREVFELVARKHALASKNIAPRLARHSITLLASILVLVNFLDCAFIFSDVLSALAKKIDDEKYGVPVSVLDELEMILPPELQCIINELFLIQFQQVRPFIKVTHRLKDRTLTLPRD